MFYQVGRPGDVVRMSVDRKKGMVNFLTNGVFVGALDISDVTASTPVRPMASLTKAKSTVRVLDAKQTHAKKHLSDMAGLEGSFLNAKIKEWEARNKSQAVPEKRAEFKRKFDAMRPKLVEALATESLKKELVAKSTWEFRIGKDTPGTKDPTPMQIRKETQRLERKFTALLAPTPTAGDDLVGFGNEDKPTAEKTILSATQMLSKIRQEDPSTTDSQASVRFFSKWGFQDESA